MATTTVPEVKTNAVEVKKTPPVSLTPNAVSKVKEIMGQQTPAPAAGIGVVGGGCSGFSYSMQFENAAGMMDKTFDIDRIEGIRRCHLCDVSERLHCRLRRDAGRCGFQVRKSEREEHLRLRVLV